MAHESTPVDPHAVHGCASSCAREQESTPPLSQACQPASTARRHTPSERCEAQWLPQQRQQGTPAPSAPAPETAPRWRRAAPAAPARETTCCAAPAPPLGLSAACLCSGQQEAGSNAGGPRSCCPLSDVRGCSTRIHAQIVQARSGGGATSRPAAKTIAPGAPVRRSPALPPWQIVAAGGAWVCWATTRCRTPCRPSFRPSFLAAAPHLPRTHRHPRLHQRLQAWSRPRRRSRHGRRGGRPL